MFRLAESCLRAKTRTCRDLPFFVVLCHARPTVEADSSNPKDTIDNQDGDKGADQLYLNVMVGATIVLQIGTNVESPATLKLRDGARERT
jgi:hypothetical protein